MSERTNKKARERPAQGGQPMRQAVDLDDLPDDLHEPIATLFWLMRETVARAHNMEDFEALVAFMETYSMVSTRMAGLLKSQRKLAEEQGMSKALQQALDKVLDEMAERGQHL